MANPGTAGIRKPVIDFAVRMELKLQKKDYKGGWDHREMSELFRSIQREIREFEEAVINQEGTNNIIGEAIDTANYLMMFVDRLERRGGPICEQI